MRGSMPSWRITYTYYCVVHGYDANTFHPPIDTCISLRWLVMRWPWSWPYYLWFGEVDPIGFPNQAFKLVFFVPWPKPIGKKPSRFGYFCRPGPFVCPVPMWCTSFTMLSWLRDYYRPRASDEKFPSTFFGTCAQYDKHCCVSIF